MPEVVGFKLTGELPPGATATDLVLTVTQILRKARRGRQVRRVLRRRRVDDVARRPGDDRQHGARVRRDDGLLPRRRPRRSRYLRRTGRTKDEVELVERYSKEQGLFRTDSATDADVHQGRATRPLDRRAVPRRAEAAAGSRAARRT